MGFLPFTRALHGFIPFTRATYFSKRPPMCAMRASFSAVSSRPLEEDAADADKRRERQEQERLEAGPKARCQFFLFF